MTYVITESCVDVKDKTCIKECPVDCIYEGDRMMYIQADECIDCGACEMVCPVEAIVYDLDATDQAGQDGMRRAAEVFLQIGAPGGARKFGPLGTDHPEVAALPPKPVDA